MRSGIARYYRYPKNFEGQENLTGCFVAKGMRGNKRFQAFGIRQETGILNAKNVMNDTSIRTSVVLNHLL